MRHTTHALIQGSELWHAHRNDSYNGSELLVAAGITANGRKREDLIRRMANGLSEEKEITPFLQKLFDDGHRFERLAMPYAEEIIGESLFPITVSITVPGLRWKLSSSLDGATDDDLVNYEHKTLNAEISEALDLGFIPDYLHWQMEQGMLINGATKTLFVASKWDEDYQLIEIKHCWYTSNPELREKIIPMWQQAEKDADAYVHVEIIPAAVAAPQMEFPAIMVVVEGKVVSTNLDAYRDAAMVRISDVNVRLAVLKTDQDFADATAEAKRFRAGTIKLKAVKEQALAQTASIDLLFKTIDLITAEMDKTSIRLEKAVKADKENAKIRIVSEANAEFSAHVAKLSERLGMTIMTGSPRLADAIKGMSSLDKMREAVKTALRNSLFDANTMTDRYERNLKSMRSLAPGLESLFADRAALIHMDAEPFDSIVINRVRAHQDAEAARLESERAKMRAEEEAKADAIAATKIALERGAMRAEEEASARARASAEAKEVTARAIRDETEKRLEFLTSSDQAQRGLIIGGPMQSFLDQCVPKEGRDNAKNLLIEWENWKVTARQYND